MMKTQSGDGPRRRAGLRTAMALLVALAVISAGLPRLAAAESVRAQQRGGPHSAAAESVPGKQRVSVGTLRTEHAVEPLGVDVPRPRLSWVLSGNGRGIRQSAYQVRVASSPQHLQRGKADVWDSGKVPSSSSVGVPYGGPALRSDTRYFWKVRVWDGEGRRSRWSTPSWWETGFLDASDWKGQWIARTATDPGEDLPEPLLRKEFSLDKPVTRARVRISGLGYYKLFLNGQRVGDHELDPGWTVYDRTAFYVTYDVTEALQRGQNAVGVSLGEGWYADDSLINGNATWKPHESEPKLLLQLDVTFADGKTMTVASDDSWKTADGPTLANSPFHGEDYDARLERPGWMLVGFDDAQWDPAVVVPAPTERLRGQPLEPIKVIESFEPVAVTEPEAGVKVYDFGATIAGKFEISVRGEAGTRITIDPSEHSATEGRPVGVAADTALDAALDGQSFSYVLKGGDTETWGPSYSYAGFRYIQITGSPQLPEVVKITALRMRSSMESVGSFDSSSSLFNRIHAAVRRTVESNLYSVPTDGAEWEKHAWTGDGHMYSDTAIQNFWMVRFYEKWLGDFADSQNAEGRIFHIVPSNRGEPGPDNYPDNSDDPVWTGAYLLVNWDLYENYGDVRSLEVHYESMQRWFDLVMRNVATTGYIYRGTSFGDWQSPGTAVLPENPFLPRSMGNVTAPEGTDIIASAFVYEEATIMARVATILGRSDDAQRYEEFAARVKAAYNDTFFDRDANVYRPDVTYSNFAAQQLQGQAGSQCVPYDPSLCYRQTPNLLALHLGIVPPEHEKAVLENLVHDVEVTRNGHLNTGTLGTKILLPLLTDNGYGELAHRVASQTTFPSWGYLIEELGADTMWEYWDDYRSRSHPYLGTIDDWFYTHLAGIKPTGPGHETIRIKPYVLGDLERAGAHIDTVRGRVASTWTREGETLELRVTIPANATAEVLVPASDNSTVTEGGRSAERAPGVRFAGMRDGYATYSVGSGTYVFRSEEPPPSRGDNEPDADSQSEPPSDAATSLEPAAAPEPSNQPLPATGGGVTLLAAVLLGAATVLRPLSRRRTGRNR